MHLDAFPAAAVQPALAAAATRRPPLAPPAPKPTRFLTVDQVRVLLDLEAEMEAHHLQVARVRQSLALLPDLES